MNTETKTPLSDEELGRIALKGYDDFWTEDCSGKDADAWVACAKAVLAAAAAPLSAPSEPEIFREVRALCTESLKHPPGTAVPIPDSIRAEYMKFMADQPSALDDLTVRQMHSLAGSIKALPAASFAPLSGRARIPVGTLIFHDHGVHRWPENTQGTEQETDLQFEVSVQGDIVTLEAPGYGGKPYRNGSILVKLKHWQAAWAKEAGK